MKSGGSDGAWMYPVAGLIAVYGAIALVLGVATLAVADRGQLSTSNPLSLGSGILVHGGNVLAVAPRIGVMAYWLVVALVAALLSAVVVVGLRHRRGGHGDHRGYASREQVRHLVARGSSPKVPADAPQCCIYLGRDVRTGKILHAATDDAGVVVGGSRSGKTSRLVANMVDAWPGPAVVTSVRADLLDATASARPGPVYVYDPTNHLGDHPLAVGFDPTAGCADLRVARLRTSSLVHSAKLGVGVTDGGFWREACAACLRVFFVAAALGDHSIADVRRWIAGADIRPAQAIFDRFPDAVPADWRDELTRHMTSPDRTRMGIVQQMLASLGSLVDPQVVRTSCPRQNGLPVFDPGRFLDEGATVYIIGPGEEQKAIGPLIAAFVEDITLHAYRRAAVSPHRRLNPALGLFLDEAANIAPLPTLPGLISAGGGSGIATWAVLQSLHQARHQWGRDVADAMLDAAPVTVIFGGLNSPDDLGAWSRLLGDVEDEVRAISRGSGGGAETRTPRMRPLLSVAQFRMLKEGNALLLYRSVPPIEVSVETVEERRRRTGR